MSVASVENGMHESTYAAVLCEIGRPLQLMELTLPKLLPGQVLVRMEWTGICHSQLNEIHGRRGPDRYLPHTLGHEGAGVVLEVGDGVAKVSAGDHVVVTWIRGLGADIGSCSYQGSDGTVNSGSVSTFMTKAVVSENRVIRIPPSFPLREAALLGCAIPTGMGLVRNEAHVEKGQCVVIFGAGGIGQVAILASKISNASMIVAVDRIAEKLQQARALGATHTIDASRSDYTVKLREMAGKIGFDAAIEASGSTAIMEQAFNAIRPGGIAVIAGNPPHGSVIRLDPMELIGGKRIVGSTGGACNLDQEIDFLIGLQESGRASFSSLISDEFQLRDINLAIAKMEGGKANRILIQTNRHNL